MPKLRVINPKGVEVLINDPSLEAGWARLGVDGWALAPVQDTTSDAGAGSSEPAPVAEPVRGKRGKPRKVRRGDVG